eukprot:TRINITY_DN1772_c0_g1_i4.p1 TRINITY_DN1772_c0_g1~~TRINITY_DN1772_c0_g1_i4.p1  ORF type:complete len:182 (+),score=56.21 TRINITY_DN1772_c0_g1_i4:28-573(+)
MCIRDSINAEYGIRGPTEMALRLISSRSVTAVRPAGARLMSDKMGDLKRVHEEEWYRRQEAEMLALQRKYAVTDKASGKPETKYFARSTSFKVADLAEAIKLDELIFGEIIPLAKTQKGYLGCERLVCGKKLDYQLITRWDTADNLTATAGASNYMQLQLQHLSQSVPGEIEQQHFMATER